MVIVSFGGQIAAIENYRWKCKDEAIQSALDLLIPAEGASPSDPHPDLTVAQNAVKKFNGVILTEGKPLESAPGVIY